MLYAIDYELISYYKTVLKKCLDNLIQNPNDSIENVLFRDSVTYLNKVDIIGVEGYVAVDGKFYKI